LGPLLISATFEDIDFKFDTQFGFGDVKTTFWRKKLRGSGQGEHRQNSVIPYLFQEPLKLQAMHEFENYTLKTLK